MEKLKILNGVGEANPQPCTKDLGYLSIEKVGDVPYAVYRTLTGVVIFKGQIDKLEAKVLKVEDDECTSWS